MRGHGNDTPGEWCGNKRFKGFIFAFVLMLAMIGTGHAYTLDQFYDVGPTWGYGTSRVDKAQTFTVGISGRLVKVDVDISRDSQTASDLLFDLRPTSNGKPVEDNGLAFLQIRIPAQTVPLTRSLLSIDLSSYNLWVNSGDLLAFVVRADNNERTYSVYGSNNNPYPSGAHYTRDPGYGFTMWSNDPGCDSGFRTYVDENTGGTISGRVTDVQGGGIASVNVGACDPTGYCSNWWTQTDGNGNYTLNAPAGNWKVTFTPPQNGGYYLQEWYNNKGNNSNNADLVAVVAGTTTPNIDALLETGGAISGRVTNAQGSGMANVNVGYCDPTGYCYGGTQTGSNGDYTLIAPAGNWKVSFYPQQNAGYYLSEWYNNKSNSNNADLVAVVTGIATPNIDVQLETGGAISGRVTNAQGNGIANVSVGYCDSTGYCLNWAQTDGTGNYSLNAPDGSWKVMFNPPQNGGNYLQEWYNNRGNNTNNADLVAVAAGQTTSGINAQLETGGVISGRVTDAQGNGIANVDAMALDPGSQMWVGGTRTDSLGNYSFATAPGSYIVRFSTDNASGYYVSEYYNNKSSSTTADLVTVAAGQTIANMNCSLDVGGRISGVIRGPAGVPLAGLNACLYDTTGTFLGMCSPPSAGDGSYTISGLAVGNYKIGVWPPSGSSYVGQYYLNAANVTAAMPVGVAAGQTTTGIDFNLTLGGGGISGFIKDAAGQPLPGLNACLYDGATGASLGKCSPSAGDGSYTISGLAPGNYKVGAWPSGDSYYVGGRYYPNSTSVSSATAITVTAGQTRTGIDFALTLTLAGKIHGIITGPDGQPIAGLTVTAYDAVTGSQVGTSPTSASDGSYTISGLANGSYRLAINGTGNTGLARGYYPHDDPYGGTIVSTMTGLTTNNINFSLTSGGTISGSVTSAASGQGISGLSVYAYHLSATGITQWNYNTTISANGSYSLMGLPPGAYKVTVNTGTGAPIYATQYYPNAKDLTRAMPLTIAAGQTISNINFSLAPGGKISGTVRNALTNQPISSGVSFSIYEGDTLIPLPFGASISSDGTYTTVGLPAGKYRLLVSATSAGYISTWYSNGYTTSDSTPILVTTGSTTGNIDVNLTPGAGKITGTVIRESDGKPLGGIVVGAFSPGPLGERVRSTTAAFDGSYTLAGMAPGAYRIYADPPDKDYAGAFYNDVRSLNAATLVNVTAALTTPNINFSLKTGGSISGVVTRASDGQPLPGVQVKVYEGSPSGSAIGYNVFTQADGSYTITGLSTGSYKVRAHTSSLNTTNDYVGLYYNNTPLNDQASFASVTVGETTTGIDFSMFTGGKISGFVRNAADSSPISSLSVRAYDAVTGSRVAASAATAFDGSYVLAGVPAGSYYLNVATSETPFTGGYYKDALINVPDTASATQVPVTVGQNATGIDFRLASSQPTGAITISGIVKDWSGNDIPGGVTVSLVSDPTKTTTTSAGGGFSLSGVPANASFSLKFSSYGYLDVYTSDIATPFDLNLNVTPTGSGFYNMPTASDLTALGFMPGAGKALIAGRVVEGAYRWSGTVGGAVVTATGNGGKTYPVTYRDGFGVLRDTNTYGNGRFYVLDVDDGDTVTVTTTKAGWAFTPATFRTHADSVSMTRVFGTAPGYDGSMSGVVKNAAGTAIPGARVELNGDGGKYTIAGSDGAFTLGALPRDTRFYLKYTATGYVPTFGGPTTLPWQGAISGFSTPLLTAQDMLARGVVGNSGYLGIKVTDQYLNPVSGVTVTLTSRDEIPYTVDYEGGGTATPATGNFGVANIRPGDVVKIEAAKEGYIFPSLTLDGFAEAMTGSYLVATTVPDEIAIRDMIAAAMTAYNSRNVNALMSYFAPNYLDRGYNYAQQRDRFISEFAGTITPLPTAASDIVINGNNATVFVAGGPGTLYLIKAGSTWLIYGNQQKYGVRAASSHQPGSYLVLLNVDDPSDAIQGVTVSGNGLSTPVALNHDAANHRWVSWGVTPPYVSVGPDFGNSLPTGLPFTYTFMITDTSGTSPYTVQVNSFITAMATPISPMANTTVAGPITFTWTPVSGDYTYDIELRNSSNNQIWSRRNMTGTTSVTYDGPALASGNYTYNILVRDPEGNSSMVTVPFSYIASIAFSGDLKTAGEIKTPIGGATVEMVGNPEIHTTTNAADGTYTLTVPAATEFSVKFTGNPATYVPTYTGVMQSTSPIVSSRGYNLYTPADLESWGVTEGRGAIRSRVLNSANADAGYVSGATVSYISSLGHTDYTVKYQDNSGNFTTGAGASTSANGKYFIVNVVEGDTVLVTATHPNYTFPQMRKFVTHAGAVSSGSVSGTAVTGRVAIAGKILNTATPNEGIENATIEQVGATSPLNATTSNADGAYYLTVPMGTTVQLKFTKPQSTTPLAPTYTANMSFGGGSTVSVGDYNLYAATKLTDWNVTPGKGIIRSRVSVRGQSGIYVGGATVTAQSALHPAIPYQICYDDACTSGKNVTDDPSVANGGRYIVRNVDPGDTVTVTAQKNGWSFSTQTFRTNADSVHQGGISGVNLTLPSPPSQSYPTAASTSGSIAVTAPAGTNWTVSSNVAWITITSGTSGSGSGTVSYTVSENTLTAPRTGTIWISGQPYTITQAGTGGTAVLKGDLNGDGLVNLADAVLALQAVSGMSSAAGIRANYASSGADANGDGKIGMEEVIYILQVLAGLR